MSESWDWGVAVRFFETLRDPLKRTDLEPHLFEAFDRTADARKRATIDSAIISKEEEARDAAIHAFVQSTFGEITTNEMAFFYQTIRAEYKRRPDVFYGYITPMEGMLRRLFGFQGVYRLGEFMFLGLSGVRKMRRTENTWAVVRMVWISLIALTTIAVALWTYSLADTNFEVAVISLLVLLYAAIFPAKRRHLVTVLEAAGSPADKEQKTWQALRIYIDALTSFLISCIALWHLVARLLSI
jgi:hypothetical protein